MYFEKKRSRYFKYPSKSYQKASQNKLNKYSESRQNIPMKMGITKGHRVTVGFRIHASIYLVTRMMENKTGHTPCPLKVEFLGPPTRSTQPWHSSGPKVPSAVVEAVSKFCANTKESVTLTSMSKGQRNQREVRAQHANVHISQHESHSFTRRDTWETDTWETLRFYVVVSLPHNPTRTLPILYTWTWAILHSFGSRKGNSL